MSVLSRIEAADPEAALPQCGALCWRIQGGKARILMVTSRDTGRWVIPKGWPMAGRSDADAAAQEAWEEAGVQGELTPDSLGSYIYLKLRPGIEDVTCRVKVFPLRVRRLSPRFPERSQRRRKWFSAEKAARKVAEPGLRDLILSFARTAAAPAGD